MNILPLTLQSAERAISDLRRGAMVVVAGKEHAIIVQAAEGCTRDALARMAALSKNTPSLLLTARRAIESITLDREAAHLKDEIMPKYAKLIYNGFWWAPERLALQALIDNI